MAIYYLKSTGSSTAPYDTEAKAATSMWDIRGLVGFSSSDTIILCDNIEETTFSGAHYTKMCNIQAKTGLSQRPEYYYNVGNNGPFYDGTAEVSFDNIKIRHNNGGAYLFNNAGNNVTSTNCIYELETNQMLRAGFYERCLIKIVYTGQMAHPLLSGSNFSLNHSTVIDNSTNSNPSIIGNITTPSSIANNIFIASNTRANTFLIAVPDEITAESIRNNIYQAPEGYDFIYDTVAGQAREGINNINADPQFKETTLYTLKTISPAINSGSDGRNIGWDLINEWVYTGKINILKGNPPVSRPNYNLRDTDNGRGFDTDSINDYSPNLYKKGSLAKPYNGYKAPNLR